ncbi:MAG: hypothetical protein Q8K88_00735 [Bradyrhizobium sp.]|nr:hypothetical protein [Bradyrhizobium sp.]
MSYRWSITVAAVLMLGGVGSATAELPIYEVTGFPVTPHQLVALGPAQAEQGLATVTPAMAGMPASPHQIAVLTPRRTENIRQEHAQYVRDLAIGRVQ